MKSYKEPEILELTDSNFDKAIVGDTPVIVDFWATWCGPCQFMSPIFEKIAKKYKTIRFARVNVDDAPGISQDMEFIQFQHSLYSKMVNQLTRQWEQ